MAKNRVHRAEIGFYREDRQKTKRSLCFKASLRINGLRAGLVWNTGNGGPNRYRLKSKELLKDFFAFCKAQPPAEASVSDPRWRKEMGAVTMDVDLYVAKLIDVFLRYKWLRMAVRNKILFRLEGEPEGTYHTALLSHNRVKSTRLVEEKYGDRIVEIQGNAIDGRYCVDGRAVRHTSS